MPGSDQMFWLQLLLMQPLAAIHFASGATPIWLPKPSSPIIVPMVCVPWLLLSPGAVGKVPVGSNQL